MGSNMMKTFFKQSMQRLCFPTTIITTSSYADTIPKDFHGLTVSSMTSLSVSPAPLLQFNVQTPSLSSKNLHSHDIFAVHQLKPELASIELVRRFSRGIKHGGTKPFVELDENKDFSIYRNAIYDSDKSVLPILKNVERVLICKKIESFHIADHEVWVGEVIDCIIEDDKITGGLLHSNGEFYKMGEKL
ncbi:similar to Kazachstania africana KAFR_0K01600 hypothetical protein [Maudiozyma saulgeensis]|uniref:Flavin reductase like domain-containing protein n=1 Tax=Maudiozyma saulgeensis TaxID=1789683 RepID=A0A1X7QY84_9SACH|nr:similar to Kazachstania africana KAFR_0K01600 hypothetical protein [Kazachstania saulgeensis]